MNPPSPIYSEDNLSPGRQNNNNNKSNKQYYIVKTPSSSIRSNSSSVAERNNHRISAADINYESIGRNSKYSYSEEMETIEVIAPKISHKDNTLISAGAEDGSVHKYSEEEKVAYSKFINECLNEQSEELEVYIPIDPMTTQLFSSCNDGVLLNKLMQLLFPTQVDLKTLVTKKKMNPFEKVQNQNIVIKNAIKIGCVVVNIGAQDLVNEVPYLILGLIWQIIKVGLLSKVNQNANEILEVLFEEKEGEVEQQEAKEEHSAESILIRWVNYHLERSSSERRIHNFSEDIQDSVVYANLFAQLVPVEFEGLVKRVQDEPNLFIRAEFVTEACERIGVKCFLTPSDIALGHPKLNLALVASLFNSEAAISEMRRQLEEKQRIEVERAERERVERERLEQERIEKERLEKERLEQERIEKERLELERMEVERVERERLEQERREKEQLEKERLERERLEKDKAEQERAERERLENLKEYRIATRIQRVVEENPALTESMTKLVGDIQELKRNLVGELRNTRQLQSELSRVTKNIDRVLENKKEGKKLKKKNKKLKPVKGVPNGLNPNKMKSYQTLFYLLQNQPQIMGKLLYLMTPLQLSKISHNLILSIFPYEVSPREEDQFLRALTVALELQVYNSPSLTELLTSDSVPMAILIDYFRKKGLKYLQEVVTPAILKVLDTKDLNLNFDPIWIHKQMVADKEIKEGKKSEKATLTPEQIAEDPEVKALHDSRIGQLLEYSSDFLNHIVKSIDQIPVQLRYLCRVLAQKCESSLKKGAEDPQVHIPYHLFVYRFVVSIISSPDLLNELVLLSHPHLTRYQRQNLSLIARLLQSAFTNRPWLHTPATPRISQWIDEKTPLAAKFLKAIPDVPNLDDLIHYTEYNQVMRENNIVFSTVVNISEIIWLHDTLLDYVYELEDLGKSLEASSSSSKSHERELHRTMSIVNAVEDRKRYKPNSGPTPNWWLPKLMDSIDSPLQIPEQGDRAIQLTFINRMEGDDGNKDQDEYREAKIWMIEILSQKFKPRPDTNTPQILKDAIAFFKTGNNNAENMGLIAKAEQLVERLKTFRQELVTSEPGVFDRFLLDVEADISVILRKNKLMKSELNRLHSLLKQIRIDASPLTRLVQFQNEQLSKVIAKKELKNKQMKLEDSKAKPVKLILSDLVKKGVVLSCDLPEASFSKTNVQIKALGGGLFEIEAKFGVISKTVTLELDTLLESSKNHVDEFPLDGITLHVNMTIHLLMKLFSL